MSNFLRLADLNATTRIVHDNGEDWIEVRSNLSKKDMDNILRSLPASMVNGGTNVDFRDVSEMAHVLFDTLMVGWSIEAPCTFENYQALDSQAAQWVDTKLFEHFSALQTTPDEKGKAQTSRKG